MGCDILSWFYFDWWYWASFHGIICHPYVFFDEASVQIFCPLFKNRDFFSESWGFFVYTLYTSPLSDMYFLCILPKSMAYFFISYSALQRAENFINLFLTLFFILFLSKNSLPNWRSQRFFLCFHLEVLYFRLYI